MPPADRPKLRPHLQPAHADPGTVVLVDRLGLASGPVRLSAREYGWLALFDGRRSVAEIHAEAARRANGTGMPPDGVARLVGRLDAGLCLDSPRFRQVVDGPVRPPSCIGCYDGDPDALRRQLRRLFTHPRGPGLPDPPRPDGRLRAALLPHIDYPRGGVSYAWGFKEVFERTDASLFVIIGTSHYSARRFTLTRKHFQTPLGVTPTDQDYVDRLVRHYGDGLFDDEWLAHLPEHSIELEVVFLQYLYAGRRDLRIVPLVVGSFHDCVRTGDDPRTRADVRRMIEALRRVEAETKEPICYLISGDLAHIGPKFEPGQKLEPWFLDHSRAQDQAILKQAEAADPLGYYQVIAAELDARSICGLPPTFVTLEALRPKSGRTLHYDRYLHPHGHESVSFASVAFYR